MEEQRRSQLKASAAAKKPYLGKADQGSFVRRSNK